MPVPNDPIIAEPLQNGTEQYRKSSSLKELTDEQMKWLKEDFWSVPCWLKEDCTKIEFRDYESFLKHNLRTRYLELEGDFRNAFSHYCYCPTTDLSYASIIVNYLKAGKTALEKNNHKEKATYLPAIANLLDIIERYMIWICPEDIVKQKINILSSRIQASRPGCYTLLCNTISNCASDKEPLSQLRATYDEVISGINNENISNYVNYGLQIERLKMLKKWGIIFIIIFICLSPFLIDYSSDSIQMHFPIPTLLKKTFLDTPLANGTIMMISLVFFGAIGGFFSGLLQIRNSEIDLSRYRESVLKFQLKPVVGCITASLISLLLIWKIVPGIEIKNIGTFIFISFLTGFSERYFLSLMEFEYKKNNSEVKQPIKDTIIKST